MKRNAVAIGMAAAVAATVAVLAPILTGSAEPTASTRIGPLELPAERTWTFDLTRQLATKTSWKAVVNDNAGSYDDGDAPSQSKICFVGGVSNQTRCTLFNDLFKDSFHHQELIDLSDAPLAAAPPVRGLVLKATGMYITGEVHQTAIWVYDRAHDEFRLISTNVVGGDWERIFDVGPLSGYLVDSNWDWRTEEGETRFGSDHRRKISVSKYMPDENGGSYRKVLEYTTDKKYGPEDTETIRAEFSTIESRLGISTQARKR